MTQFEKFVLERSVNDFMDKVRTTIHGDVENSEVIIALSNKSNPYIETKVYGAESATIISTGIDLAVHGAVDMAMPLHVLQNYVADMYENCIEEMRRNDPSD